jgi:flagellar motor switch protein FliN
MTEEKNEDSTPPENTAADPGGKASRLPDVPVTVSMELGRTMTTLNEVLSIGEQSIIEMDRRVGDPIDIYLNGKLFARGEVVTVSENFGVRVTELMSPE